MRTARDALDDAMQKTGTPKERIPELAREMFPGEEDLTWESMTETQRWGVVCAVDPRAIGPYGNSMEPF